MPIDISRAGYLNSNLMLRWDSPFKLAVTVLITEMRKRSILTFDLAMT